MTPSPPASALRRIDAVFGGMTAPAEGCLHCYGAGELALLAVPRAPLGDDLVRILMHEVPSHFTDHPAVVRRLLPEFFSFVAHGRFSGMAYLPTGLGRTAWREWPAEQAAAIEGFLDAWWRETLADPEPVYGVQAVWELCADIHGSVTPLLDAWDSAPGGGAEDRHLAGRAEHWLDDLLQDDVSLVVPWGSEPLAELQEWLVTRAVPRLAGQADPLLVAKIGLLALGPEERWPAYAELVASAG
ncbi:hypothetical protein [Streptomyces sp. NPDC058664]|uniref:hypothetical protein n=1 Tax=unclassified Streptomyces TaxID=2593676 RepID=UPI0036647399